MSPMVQLRNHGPDQRRTPRAATPLERSGLSNHLPLVLHQWPPAHCTSFGSAHFILAGLRPELYYSASQSERLIQPTKCQACVQHDKRRTANRSLNDTDRVAITI